MNLARRHFLASCAAGIAFPITACSARAAGGQFSPEAFGAKGDGVSDDYDAFQKLAGAVSAARGGSVAFTPGRTYALNRYIARGNGISDLAFEGCDGLTIEGNGATISVKGDFRRDHASTRSLAGLMFRDCRNVVLRKLEVVGNVDRTARGAGLAEPASHGLIFQSCSDVLIDGVVVRHFAADGLYIRESKRLGPSGTRQASRRFTVRNSRFLFNARQGLSVIQLRGGLFEDCEFSYTGFIDESGSRGPYGGHSPAAGADVEPNNTPTFGDRVDVLTGDLLFRRCRMVGNFGAAFLAAKYARGQQFADQIRLESCHLQCNEGETGGRDGFIFDVDGEVTGCTLQMVDKTAYLGWYPLSEASPRFTGNTVSGRNPLPDHPLFAVRRTRGAPLIEGNNFIGEQRQVKPLSGSALVVIDNPSATVRNNRIVIPAEAFPSYGTMQPAVLAEARLMEGNSYETNLGGGPGTGYFGVLYGSGTMARSETFHGTRPGPADSIRPVDAITRKPWPHDTGQPWSRF